MISVKIRDGVREGYCCNQWIQLDRFTNTCPSCEADYNSSGQRLAPREQWGEETGETIGEILMADTNPWGQNDHT